MAHAKKIETPNAIAQVCGLELSEAKDLTPGMKDASSAQYAAHFMFSKGYARNGATVLSRAPVKNNVLRCTELVMVPLLLSHFKKMFWRSSR